MAGMDPAKGVIGGAQSVELRIRVVGDTNWTVMGGPWGYGVASVVTATAASADFSTGTAQEVGICVLVNTLTPTAGTLSISSFSKDSTETAVSKITNKCVHFFGFP